VAAINYLLYGFDFKFVWISLLLMGTALKAIFDGLAVSSKPVVIHWRAW
jgi:hypothetical protein